jgi:hypothetical protein
MPIPIPFSGMVRLGWWVPCYVCRQCPKKIPVALCLVVNVPYIGYRGRGSGVGYVGRQVGAHTCRWLGLCARVYG